MRHSKDSTLAVTRSQATINDKPLTFETGKYARQAGGAVTVRYGDTLVFAAGTVARRPARHRLLPAHRRLRRAPLRRGQDPRLVPAP